MWFMYSTPGEPGDDGRLKVSNKLRKEVRRIAVEKSL